MRLLICISLCIHFPFFNFFLSFSFFLAQIQTSRAPFQSETSAQICVRGDVYLKNEEKKKGSYFVWCKDSQNTNANKKNRIQATACCQGLVFNLLSLWCRLRKIYESVSKSRGFVCVFDLFFFQLQYWYCCFLQTLHWRHGNCSLQLQHPDKNTSFNWKKIQSIIFLFYFFLFLWVEDVVQFRLCLWWKVPKISRGILSWFQLQDRYENLWKKKYISFICKTGQR